jgi:hypothetical protein
MKYWHILIIFIMAWAVVIIGALFKIQHWTGASMLLILGMGGQVVSLLLLAAKIVTDRKANRFLNK